MSSTGAIPRTKKMMAALPVASTLHPDTQILVGQEASEPLDIKLITMSANGVQTRVPALHKSWCCARELMHYLPPPSEGLELAGALDAWLEQMDFFRQDLEWMLELPHHRFWSELVFERKVHNCLVSYLSQAPRWYDERPNIAEQHHNIVAPVLASLHRLVLLVHVRMATYKESKTCHITPSAFGNLVYQNYILDVCQLLDLCALYCPSNKALLAKMVNNVFSAEPRYSHDLEEVLISIGTALDNVEHRLGVSESSVPQSLHSAAHSSGAGLDDLLAIVYYLLDTCYTLHNLVLVHPPASRLLHKNDLHIRLAVCYERVMPSLSQRLCQHRHPAMDGDPDGVERALARLQQLRVTALAAFRAATEAVCLTPLQQDGVSGHVISECLEAYLHVVSSCLAEKTFITDYHTTFSFTKDIIIFKDLSSDATSLQFIEEAVKTVLEETGVTDQPPPLPPLTNGHGPRDTESPAGDSSGMSLYVASGSAEVDAVQLAEFVSTVHELLPELGAGFITKCLKHFRYSTEAVINAVLEGSLPADLAVLDRSLASADLPSQQMEVAAPASTAPVRVTGADTSYCNSYEQAVDEAKLSVMNRANIYNDDEFDVFSSNRVDTTKVHRGKKKKEVSETDEAIKERVRTLGHQYDERAGRSIYEDEYEAGHVSEEDGDLLPDADYNDEYDDTYDDNEAGNLDASTEIMMPSRKLNFKTRPTIFGRGTLNAPLANGVGGSDEEEEASDNGPGPVGRRSLPTEENEEEFGRRRGLRKGVGGVEFMLELRDSGGVIQNKPLQYERNLPASHNSTNNQKKRGQRRNLPRDYHRDHHRPLYVNAGGGSQQETDDISEESSATAGGVQKEDEEDDSSAGPRIGFTPFCDDPAVVRQRQANTWASRDAARNRGGNTGRRQQGNMPPPQPMNVGRLDGTPHPSATGAYDGRNSFRGGATQPQAEGALRGSSYRGSNYRGSTQPITYTNKSDRSWRQGTDDEARGSKGGQCELQEEDEEDDSSAGPRLSFTPFCEDPAVVRQRQANTWASRDAARNRGGNKGRRQQGNMPPPQPMPLGSLDGTSHPSAEGAVGGSNNYSDGATQPQADGAVGGSSYRGGTRPKTYTNKSGKSWRQGTDDEARGSKGGKWKEDTNHGSAQDPNFRRKMENKNKARKQAAQNKFNKNN